MSRFDFIPERTLFSPQNKRLLRYLIVGAVGVAVNQVVFLFVFNNTGIPYFIAGFLGSSVSTFTNYAINDSWTWKDRGAAGVIQWFWRGIKYAATRIVGIGIGTIAQIVFVEILLINPAIANILKIGVGVLWGFGASEKWVWRSNKTPQNGPTTPASDDN